MQAIQTKYLGPTNHKGSRIVAKCSAGRIVVSWDHALSAEDNHRSAAEALACKKLEYLEHLLAKRRLISGVLPDGSYAHVFSE